MTWRDAVTWLMIAVQAGVTGFAIGHYYGYKAGKRYMKTMMKNVLNYQYGPFGEVDND